MQSRVDPYDIAVFRGLEGKTESTERGFRFESEAASALMLFVDTNLRVTRAGEATLTNHKYYGSGVIGQHCYRIIHQRSTPCQFRSQGCPVKIAFHCGRPIQSAPSKTSDIAPSEQSCCASAVPITNEYGDVTEVVLLVRNFTDTSDKLNQEILEAQRTILAMNAITDAVCQSLDLDIVLNSALDKVLELARESAGAILLFDEVSHTLVPQIYRNVSKEALERIAGLMVEGSINARVIQQGEPIFIRDTASNRDRHYSMLQEEGLRAFASIPLRSRNRILGVLNVASYTPHLCQRRDLQLLNNVSYQIAVAIENARLYEELQHKEKVRGELLQKLISMQEEERRRIAHELHDETSQALTSQLVKLEAIIAELPPESQSITSKLREIQGTITNMHDEIHRVIYELHPTPLDDLGLVAAIRWQSENQLSNAGVAFYFEAAGRERRLSRKVEAALFRITQEAITNVVRHACAESTAISLEFREDSVAVVIEDDGKGFDFQETPIRPSVRQGIGLLSMKERAEFLGGDFSIESGDSCGTLVMVEIPLIRDDSDG